MSYLIPHTSYGVIPHTSYVKAKHNFGQVRHGARAGWEKRLSFKNPTVEVKKLELRMTTHT